MKSASIEAELEFQAHACEAMRSPFVATFLRTALEDYRGGSRVRDLLDSRADRSRPGLRLSGAFHYLALAGETTLRRHYPSVGGDGDARRAWYAASALFDREPELVEHLFDENVQTNEVQRSMPILGAFLHLSTAFGLPFRVFEIGASAGFNSRFDRYRYVERDWQWGPNSALTLENRTTSGRPESIDAPITVIERRACDPFPIDVTETRAVRRLESFVWPDQIDRLSRLRAAIAIARSIPIEIEAEAFATWLPRAVRPQNGATTVVLQSLVEEHLTDAQRDELHAIIATIGSQATASAPFAYVRMELAGADFETTVRRWPSDRTTTICHSDGHAQDIRWR